MSGPTPQQKLEEFYGGEEHISPWLEVTQQAVNQFAESTLDRNWIHIDPERAARESPFGGPIAHGLFTLSLLPYLIEKGLGELRPPGVQMGVNYGFDRVRMMTPVPIGAKVRNKSRLKEIQFKGGNRYIVLTENTIEIDGMEKPALVADWLFMLFVDDSPHSSN